MSESPDDQLAEAIIAAYPPDDLIDGCIGDLTDAEIVDDGDLDAVVLFADAAPDEVEARAVEWRELFGGP